MYGCDKMSEIGKDELILRDGWPDCYQERKVSNHVAATQLPEGVVASYCRALRWRGRDNAITARKEHAL